MMSLVSFIQSCGINVDRSNYKVHLAVAGGNDNPLNAYFEGRFDDYQGVQTKKNFQCNHVVSLISLGANRWLFVGVFEILSVEPYKTNLYWYESRLLPDQEDLVGRVVVTYHRTGRASYRKGPTIENQCIVNELLPERMSIDAYPGHNNVIINYAKLDTIVRLQEPSWKGALSSVKGIYCITDNTNGKQYIGKADGQDGIWQRWSTYANNGHGDNKELKNLLEKEGELYKNNFQFTLLEIADFKTTDEEIDLREAHWKNALLTRTYGYNAN